MAVSLSYDPALARVLINGVSYANLNPYFEVDASDWVGQGGTIARSTAQFHQGVASGLFTPDGVTATCVARSNLTVPALPGQLFRVRAWLRCAVARSVSLQARWYDAPLATVTAGQVTISVAANTWTLFDGVFTAPANTAWVRIAAAMTGTPPAGNLLYIDEATLMTSPATVERSTDQIRWTTVRGGTDLPIGAIAPVISDYEFTPGVPNYYRVKGQTATSITPAQMGTWLKSVQQPFLNMQVTPRPLAPQTRSPRGGVFDAVGESFPVATTDYTGSKRFDLGLRTRGIAETSDLEYLVSAGDIMLLQPPAGSRIPSGYVKLISDARAQPLGASSAVHWTLPLQIVDAPDADVIGATATCDTILANFATCDAVLAAFATCNDLMNYVANPSDVIVP